MTQNRQGLAKLDSVLKLLFCIYNMSAFKYCFPFRNRMEHELTSLFRETSDEWLEKVRREHMEQGSLAGRADNDHQRLRRLVEVSQVVYSDLYLAFKFYSPVIENIANIHYFQILFKRTDIFLFELIDKCLVDEVCQKLLLLLLFLFLFLFLSFDYHAAFVRKFSCI